MTSDPVVPSEIVRRAIAILREHFVVLYPVALIFGLVQAMVTYALEDTSVAGLAVALTLVTGTFFQGMVVGFVRDVDQGLPRGREPSMGALLRGVAPVVDKLLLVSLISAILIGIGLVLLIVPGLILLTIWAVAAPVVVLERTGVRGAFERSRELVRGHGRPVFLTLLLLLLLLLPAGVITLGAVEAFGDVAGSFVQVLASSLAATISVLAVATLYFRLRAAEDGRGTEDEPAAGEQAVAPPAGPGGPIA